MDETLLVWCFSCKTCSNACGFGDNHLPFLGWALKPENMRNLLFSMRSIFSLYYIKNIRQQSESKLIPYQYCLSVIIWRSSLKGFHQKKNRKSKMHINFMKFQDKTTSNCARQDNVKETSSLRFPPLVWSFDCSVIYPINTSKSISALSGTINLKKYI